MSYLNHRLPKGLYVFGGEKAQGAEIVIERLISNNNQVNAHLMISPGDFAFKLLKSNKHYKITLLDDLKKLNRSSVSKTNYYLRAIKNYIGVSYSVVKYITKHKIDFVHVNTIVPSSYLLPAIMYCHIFHSQIKWYWSDHDMRYFSKVEFFLAKLCARFYTKTLVVSNAVKSKYGDNEKVIVLYNGLNVEEYKPDASRRQSFRLNYEIDESTIVIGMPAVITPDKGQLSLIQAVKNLHVSHKNILLLLAGGFANDTPEYSQDIRVQISECGYIKYLGFIDDMVDFYNGCDIIVNNSNNKRSESLGTSIYEAMACEKNVVASATGGTPEIISQNEDGFLFEADNEDALLQSLSNIIKCYDQLGNIRTAARKKVNSKFNIAKMVSNYNSLLSI